MAEGRRSGYRFEEEALSRVQQRAEGSRFVDPNGDPGTDLLVSTLT